MSNGKMQSQDPDKTPQLKAIFDSRIKIPQVDVEFINSNINQLLLIDCRWPYEYEGGSIVGAFNCWNATLVNECILQDFNINATIVIFREYSQRRGPRLASYL